GADADPGSPANMRYDEACDRLDAALASLSAPKQEGEWVMVPRKPTEAMLSHGEGWEYSTISDGAAMARQVYADMLAAAPKPSPMNDNAVAVNEVAPVNDKPESAEAVAWVRPSALATMNRCRNDDVNGCVDVWMRPDGEHTIP